MPGMKPGVSTKTTSGRRKRSQRQMKRLAFSAAAASITPPSLRGWLAITPTGRPSMRPIAVTMFGAQRGETSSICPESTQAAITSRTS